METSPTIIIVVGPTAVGKTAFAIRLAQMLQTDIISADSRQCYRELTIGVAKPSEQELKQVKHYFINSHSVHEDVNAAMFEQYALDAAQQIFREHRVAVMVGGTGLYVKAFTDGLDEIPAVDENIRAELIREYENKGIAWLQEQVRTSDPLFWERGEQQNPQRLMRALEVMRSTGHSILSFRTNVKRERPFRVIKIGLELPRPVLYQRINTRVWQMMEEGLVQEVSGLLPVRHLNALQTVGYSEIFAYLDGAISLEQAVQDIQRNTRHYAKRQLTWFRRDPEIQWIPPDYPVEKILEELGMRNKK